jgi:hypothetical protein
MSPAPDSNEVDFGGYSMVDTNRRVGAGGAHMGDGDEGGGTIGADEGRERHYHCLRRACSGGGGPY